MTMKPMLLTNFEDYPVAYPLWVERKVNGHRCMVIVDESGNGTAYTREGGVLRAARIIAEELEDVGPGYYDGEVYAGSWGATQSAVKSGHGERLMYHVWDYLTPAELRAGGTMAPLHDRRQRLELMAIGSAHVCLHPGRVIDSEEDLGDEFATAMAAGEEGLVVKMLHSGYRCGTRSTEWQKLKAGKSEEW
jgi:ATP-dependent DNA ligase